MATPSGNSPSSSASTQGSGRNNKRKLEANSPTYGQYLQIKYGFLNSHAHDCDICRSLITNGSGEELQLDNYAYDSKLNLTKTEVEDMILGHLDVIYGNVIKDLISYYGYPEDDATTAVLATGICCGCKDPIGNALKHALIFLKCGLSVEKPEKKNFSVELKTMVKFVSVIVYDGQKKQHPDLYMDDFLLWLLFYKIDPSPASTPFGSLGNLKVSSSSTGLQWMVESTCNSSTVQFIPEVGDTEDDKLDAPSPHSANASKLAFTSSIGIQSLPSCRFAGMTSLSLPSSNPNAAKKINLISSSDKFSSLTISESTISEEKPGYADLKHADSSRKGFTHRRPDMRRQARIIGKTRKLVTLTNRILESKGSTMQDSNCSLPKPDKTIVLESSQTFATRNFSCHAGSFATSSFSMSIVNTTSSLSHAANADAFASISSCKKSSDACLKTDYSVAEIPYVLGRFLSRGKDLKVQLQYWKNWARHKVIQATNRLNQDKAELQTLRKEKLEATKEKEAFADSTMKKIGEMDNALSRERTEVEVASAAICKLEFEKVRLEQELEAAKIRASESAAHSREASLEEDVTLKKAQACERERTLFQEELGTEKRVLSQLQQQLQKAQMSHGQLEVITSKFSDTVCSLHFVWVVYFAPKKVVQHLSYDIMQ